jgi:hypothetical protein
MSFQNQRALNQALKTFESEMGQAAQKFPYQSNGELFFKSFVK